MSNIYLIRHGFTPANNARYNNQSGIRNISEDENMPLEKIYGEKQAIELGMFLNQIEGKTLILVSPYKRARQTLEIAMNYMDKDYTIKICDELFEKKSGIHYARTKEELLKIDSKSINEFYNNMEKDPFNTRYIDGESEYDVRERTKDISKSIVDISLSNKYDNIFVVAHGTVNKWLFYWINDYYFDYIEKNCEVIMANGKERGKTVFTPKTFVPKGFMVDIEKY